MDQNLGASETETTAAPAADGDSGAPDVAEQSAGDMDALLAQLEAANDK